MVCCSMEQERLETRREASSRVSIETYIHVDVVGGNQVSQRTSPRRSPRLLLPLTDTWLPPSNGPTRQPPRGRGRREPTTTAGRHRLGRINGGPAEGAVLHHSLPSLFLLPLLPTTTTPPPSSSSSSSSKKGKAQSRWPPPSRRRRPGWASSAC